MIAKLHIPSYPLNQFVANFFYHAGFLPEHKIDRFLPDGNVQLIFDLTNNSQYIYDNETLTEIQICRKVWLSGFRTEPITIPSGIESEMLIVEFHKGKAFSFFNTPLYALKNLVVDAELVFTKNILDIREQLLDAHTVSQKFELLEERLVDICLNKIKENPFVEYLVSETILHPNHLKLRSVCHEIGYSQKHIISVFKKYVGVTPKEFLKIIRFQKAIEQIEKYQRIDWVSLAFDCGFYDQSHFISDFKKFSGFTPSQYLRHKGETLNYVPIY